MIRQQTVTLDIVYDDGQVLAPARWDWDMVLRVLIRQGAVHDIKVVDSTSTKAVW